MPSDHKDPIQGAAILTRGVENIFRKLISFLVGKISLVKLQEMIRYIYVEEAEGKLRKERPKKVVSLTRLALMTGLDTRTLAKIRSSERYQRPLHQEDRFVKAMTPESCVLDIWISNSVFRDPGTGEPSTLKLHGGKASFENLVKEAVPSRGVTTQSILDSLINNQAVVFDEPTQSVELLEKIEAPYKAGNQWGTLEVGLLHTCSLLDTVFYNFEAVRDDKSPFYQRGCWTTRLSPVNRQEFQKKIKNLLEESNENAREMIAGFEENYSSREHLTAGLSMFYFEESLTNT